MHEGKYSRSEKYQGRQLFVRDVGVLCERLRAVVNNCYMIILYI